jgi:hypothetical protein
MKILRWNDRAIFRRFRSGRAEVWEVFGGFGETWQTFDLKRELDGFYHTIIVY